MTKRVMKLYHGITFIDDDLIEAAREYAPRRTRPWIGWGAVAACLALLLALALPRPTDGTASVPRDNGNFADGSDAAYGGITSGGIRPVLRVGGALYRCTGMSLPVYLDASAGVYVTDGSADTVLPEGFSARGELSGVTAEEPTEDMQLQAGFAATGTVYTSADYPNVVYARLTTAWFAEQYVRFAADALGENRLIAWQGRNYRVAIGHAGEEDILRELPEGAVPLGTLHYVGQDAAPENDLETNCREDDYAKPLDGREVYADPNDDSRLYVYERHYWREGDYPAWLICPLWE